VPSACIATAPIHRPCIDTSRSSGVHSPRASLAGILKTSRRFLRRSTSSPPYGPDWGGFKREAEDVNRLEGRFFRMQLGRPAPNPASAIPPAGSRLNVEAAKAAGRGRRAGLLIPPEKAIAGNHPSIPAEALGAWSRRSAHRGGRVRTSFSVRRQPLQRPTAKADLGPSLGGFYETGTVLPRSV